jgi:hypothetical protein
VYDTTKSPLKELRYKDSMEDVSRAIHHHFGSLAYRQGMIMIQEVCVNPDAQDILFSKPWMFLNIDRKIKNNEYDKHIENIKLYILNHLNPVYCSIKCLTLLDRLDRELLEKMIEPHCVVFNLEPTKRTKKIFDGTKIREKYNVSCMNWIYKFINR